LAFFVKAPGRRIAPAIHFSAIVLSSYFPPSFRLVAIFGEIIGLFILPLIFIPQVLVATASSFSFGFPRQTTQVTASGAPEEYPGAT